MATPADGLAATVVDPDGVTVELLGQALTLRGGQEPRWLNPARSVVARTTRSLPSASA